MDMYFTSLLLYAIPANIVAAFILVLGRKKMPLGKRKVDWHPAEYMLIYLPWFGFIGLTMVIFGGLNQVPDYAGIRTFILVLQSIGSGIMGGLILLPRLFVETDKWPRLQVSGISAFVVSLLYVKFRMMLFIMIAGLTSQVD